MARHPSVVQSDYAALKQLVRDRGLFRRQPRYYVGKICLTLSLLALSGAILFLVRSVWLQVLNAAFLAFVFTQIGFLAHDVGHRQLLTGRWRNAIGGMFFGNLLLGMSEEWWVAKHNRHHGHPNHLGMDPDIDVPVLAFTVDQALSKRGYENLAARREIVLGLTLQLRAMLPYGSPRSRRWIGSRCRHGVSLG